jgi:hypothetical protein
MRLTAYYTLSKRSLRYRSLGISNFQYGNPEGPVPQMPPGREKEHIQDESQARYRTNDLSITQGYESFFLSLYGHNRQYDNADGGMAAFSVCLT